MKELTEHQVCCMLSLGIISIKFVVFPALYAKFAYQNMYWCAIFSSLIDACFVFITLWFLKRHPDKTLKEVLEESYGKIFSKIVYLILFLYFFIKSVLILKETHNYFLNNLFENLNWFNFILPFMLLISYIMFKSLRTVGRSVELFSVIIGIALILGLIIPLSIFDFNNILPFLNNGFSPVFEGVFKGNFSYGDYLIVLMLFGKIKYSSKTSKKLWTYWIFTTLFVFVFYFAYSGVFSITGLNQNPSISKLSLTASFPSTVSRLDWVAIIVWTIILIFQTGIYMVFALDCFLNLTQIKNKVLGISILNVLLFVVALLLYLNLELSIKFITSNIFAIASIVIQIAIPLLLIISHYILIFRENKNGNFKKVFKE